MYKFSLTNTKVAIILILAYLFWGTAGQLTIWLLSKDLFAVAMFFALLWGLSSFPVWLLDWVLFWFKKYTNNKKHNYIKFEEFKNEQHRR